MEIQLKELIDQIKKAGVEAAEDKAASIIESAQSRADKIIADAEAKAKKMLLDAKAENDRTVKSGEDALRQASRNVLISFRESIAKELEAVLKSSISETYSPSVLCELIKKAIESWAVNPDAEDICVLLNSKDLNTVQDMLLSGVKESLIKGVTLKPDDSFDGGFRIAVNKDGAYYDYSSQAVSEMMSVYLSPKVTELLKEADEV